MIEVVCGEWDRSRATKADRQRSSQVQKAITEWEVVIFDSAGTPLSDPFTVRQLHGGAYGFVLPDQLDPTAPARIDASLRSLEAIKRYLQGQKQASQVLEKIEENLAAIEKRIELG